MQRVQEVEKMAARQNGVENGGCGDDKRKAGVVRNDLRDAKIALAGQKKHSPGL